MSFGEVGLRHGLRHHPEGGSELSGVTLDGLTRMVGQLFIQRNAWYRVKAQYQ